MLAQRTMMQASLRRIAARPQLLRPLLSQTRASTTLTPDTKPGVTTPGVTPQLVEQRLKRPVSPHLGIYQPQITWYLSSFHRITGSVLSGGFYIFGFGYLVSPLFGIHAFESPTMVAAFASLGLVTKALIKFTLAFPFTFHSFNGLRHLMWDTGSGITNKQVQVSGWIIVGLSTATAAGLAMIGGGSA